MNSIELEKALLGCLITDSQYIDPVKQWITEEDFFYSSFNKKVWKAIDKLHSRGLDVDVNTVCEEVGNSKDGYHSMYEISGFLEKVTSPSKANVYARKLHSYYLRRILDTQMHSISNNINDGSLDTNRLLEDAHTTIGNIIKLQPNKTFDMDGLLDKTKESIFESTTLIPTGINTLDRVITGMTRGEITIIAGRPGNAKTTVSANIARNLVHQGMKVAMFNREMPNTDDEEVFSYGV